MRDIHIPWNTAELLSASPFQKQYSNINSLVFCVKLFWGSETDDFMWIYQILESAPSWSARQSTQEKRKFKQIIFIWSFPLGYLWLGFSWESFLFKLNYIIYTSYHKTSTVSQVSQKLRGQCTLRVCHPIHCQQGIKVLSLNHTQTLYGRNENLM